jgi:hypothetical protein
VWKPSAFGSFPDCSAGKKVKTSSLLRKQNSMCCPAVMKRNGYISHYPPPKAGFVYRQIRLFCCTRESIYPLLDCPRTSVVCNTPVVSTSDFGSPSPRFFLIAALTAATRSDQGTESDSKAPEAPRRGPSQAVDKDTFQSLAELAQHLSKRP